MMLVGLKAPRNDTQPIALRMDALNETAVSPDTEGFLGSRAVVNNIQVCARTQYACLFVKSSFAN
jgi:hypothetical protein